MTASRPPSQLELDLPLPGRGEAPRPGGQEVEAVTATPEPESPASTNHLMEAICAPDNIEAASGVRWCATRERLALTGSPSNNCPAVLKARWPEIEGQLLQGRYQPQPVRRVTIPKPAGGTRNLGHSNRDGSRDPASGSAAASAAVGPDVQRAQLRLPAGQPAHQAVAQAQAYVIAGYQFVVDIDLAKFFDRVNHDRLVAAVAARVSDRRLLRLIRSYLTAGVLDNGLFETNREGVPKAVRSHPCFRTSCWTSWIANLSVVATGSCATQTLQRLCSQRKGRPACHGEPDPLHRTAPQASGQRGEECCCPAVAPVIPWLHRQE